MIQTNFYLEHFMFFSLSLLISLWKFFLRQIIMILIRKFPYYSQSFFSLCILSLRHILINFDLGHFIFFSQSFSLCVIYPRGRSVCIKAEKRFILFFLHSMKALLEADPNEFSFETFYVFFSQSFFSLWKFLLRQKRIQIEEIFHFVLSFSSLV